jgi:hypothetical protein
MQYANKYLSRMQHAEALNDKCLSGGTQDALPLESRGMNKGRDRQPCADGAAFFVLTPGQTTL